MKLIDRSGKDNKSIVALAKFAKRYFKFEDKAVVLVEPSPRGLITSGRAYSVSPISFDAQRPSMAIVLMGRLTRYPILSKYIDEVGPVQLNSWQEEFIFVLSHELQHIDDFWTYQGLDRHTLEVRAEKKAAAVLVAFRSAMCRIKMKQAA